MRATTVGRVLLSNNYVGILFLVTLALLTATNYKYSQGLIIILDFDSNRGKLYQNTTMILPYH